MAANCSAECRSSPIPNAEYCCTYPYRELAIQDGSTACEMWNRLVSGQLQGSMAAQRAQDLLIYCGLDTRGMFEIWKVLFTAASAKAVA